MMLSIIGNFLSTAQKYNRKKILSIIGQGLTFLTIIVEVHGMIKSNVSMRLYCAKSKGEISVCKNNAWYKLWCMGVTLINL